MKIVTKRQQQAIDDITEKKIAAALCFGSNFYEKNGRHFTEKEHQSLVDNLFYSDTVIINKQ